MRPVHLHAVVAFLLATIQAGGAHAYSSSTVQDSARRAAASVLLVSAAQTESQLASPRPEAHIRMATEFSCQRYKSAVRAAFAQFAAAGAEPPVNSSYELESWARMQWVMARYDLACGGHAAEAALAAQDDPNVQAAAKKLMAACGTMAKEPACGDEGRAYAATLLPYLSRIAADQPVAAATSSESTTPAPSNRTTPESQDARTLPENSAPTPASSLAPPDPSDDDRER